MEKLYYRSFLGRKPNVLLVIIIVFFTHSCNENARIIGNWYYIDRSGDYNEIYFNDSTYTNCSYEEGLILSEYEIKESRLFVERNHEVITLRIEWLNPNELFLYETDSTPIHLFRFDSNIKLQKKLYKDVDLLNDFFQEFSKRRTKHLKKIAPHTNEGLQSTQ